MSLSFQKLTAENLAEWTSFCKGHSEAWVHHFGMTLVEPFASHMITIDGKVKALIPLNIEGHAGSLFGLSLPTPLICDEVSRNSKLYRKLEKSLHQFIDDFVKEHGLKKISFINYASESYLYNPLKKFGYLDASFLEMNLSLVEEEKTLFSNLSKGHKSDLKKILQAQDLSLDTFHETGERLKEILLKIEDFEEDHLCYLCQLVDCNLAEVKILRNKDMDLAAALFLKFNKDVQYHEAVNFQKNLPGHHALLWLACLAYKDQEFENMDLGVFTYHSQLNFISNPKKSQIGVFKRGFAPKVSQIFIGEKYYDHKLFFETFSKRVENFQQAEFK